MIRRPRMNDGKPAWYLTGDDGQPAGPYPEARIVEEIQAGEHSEATLCWREGMGGWQPLGDFEPFAREFKKRRASYRRRAVWIALVVSLVGCLTAGGVAAYFVLLGPAEIRQGRKYIAEASYAQAAAVLAPYVKHKPLNNEARYLLAIARINQFATGDTNADGGIVEAVSSLLQSTMIGSIESIEEAKRDLRRVLDAEPERRERARRDMAAAVARVPPGDVDAAARILEIDRIRAELGLEAPGELAGGLLALATSAGNSNGRLVLRDRAVALQIYDWDASLGKRLVERALAAGPGPGQGLPMVLETLRQWVAERPALAGEVVSQLWSKAESLYAAGSLAEAKAVLSEILEIDPQGPATREQILLCVRLLDPGDQKLKSCRLFSEKYPNDAAVAEALLAIVKDAVVVFDGAGRFDRSRSRPYMDAGVSAAMSLLGKWPQTDKLDVHAYELAKRLAQDGQCEKVLVLARSASAVTVDEALRQQIEALRGECDPNRVRSLAAVQEAIACFDRTETWDGPTAQACMSEGLSAAGNLLEKWPRTAGLDALVYGLARRLAQGDRCLEAIDLSRRLLAAVPNSGLNGQIEAGIAQWEKTCIVRISDAGVLQRTLAGGVKAEVLWVALSKADVGTETTRMLQGWTLAGGVLWVETDLAEAFGLGEVARMAPARSHIDAVVPRNIVHPIVNGLQGMHIGCEVSASGGEIVGAQRAIFDPEARDLLPLLVEPTQDPRLHTVARVLCGGRRCGRGIVVFRPEKIDTASYAGRRFEENLRSFRLGTADRLSPGRQSDVRPEQVGPYVAPSVTR
jgi:tetratricopeptide (TPR) repeat protein